MPVLPDFLQAKRPDTLTSAREILNAVRRDGHAYFQSPIDWRDEVLYFLLPDRFSDGKEQGRQLLTREEIAGLRRSPARSNWNWQNWARSGSRWQGGTIRGITGKLPYLRELGVTSIWVGPLFKQRTRLDTYHGYGIQDFLDIDPRFGSRADLFNLVKAAHDLDLRIILDIIINHSGDNWGYVEPGKDLATAGNQPPYLPWPNYYGNPFDDSLAKWRGAWRDKEGKGFTTDGSQLTDGDDGVWPRELQNFSRYTRAGSGDLGAGAIEEPHAEHKRTDFLTLKDFALDVGATLSFLSDCFKYWIAISDCDGFRIDTVKHMALDEARNFCGSIREFADTLGKRNFFLVGEIAGGDYYQDFYIDRLGLSRRNMSAALDIGPARLNLRNIGKGLQDPGAYFDGFTETDEGFGSHRTLGDRHVSVLDDHDHVFGGKTRFSADIPDDSPVKDYQVVAPTAIQLFTLGVSCIYYGTEQAFAGPAHSQLSYLLNEGWGGNDRFLRESMFGPEHPRASHDQDIETQLQTVDQELPGFGPFGTAGKHCFDQASPAYVRIAHLGKVRSSHPVLRVGRQYRRQTRLPGTGFVFQPQGELIAWSRILDNFEAVCIVNPNGIASRGGDVIVAGELSAPGDRYTVVANTAHAAAAGGYSGSHPVGSTLTVAGGTATHEPLYLAVRDVQPAEVVIFVKNI